MAEKLFRVLSLDGGGAKGFYTLGILREIEAGIPIHAGHPLLRCEAGVLDYGLVGLCSVKPGARRGRSDSPVSSMR